MVLLSLALCRTFSDPRTLPAWCVPVFFHGLWRFGSPCKFSLFASLVQCLVLLGVDLAFTA